MCRQGADIAVGIAATPLGFALANRGVVVRLGSRLRCRRQAVEIERHLIRDDTRHPFRSSAEDHRFEAVDYCCEFVDFRGHGDDHLRQFGWVLRQLIGANRHGPEYCEMPSKAMQINTFRQFGEAVGPTFAVPASSPGRPLNSKTATMSDA